MTLHRSRACVLAGERLAAKTEILIIHSSKGEPR